jgi:hypothetical protein
MLTNLRMRTLSLLFAYMDLLGCLDEGNIDVELYGNSDVFQHPKKTEWVAHLIMTVGAYQWSHPLDVHFDFEL